MKLCQVSLSILRIVKATLETLEHNIFHRNIKYLRNKILTFIKNKLHFEDKVLIIYWKCCSSWFTESLITEITLEEEILYRFKFVGYKIFLCSWRWTEISFKKKHYLLSSIGAFNSPILLQYSEWIIMLQDKERISLISKEDWNINLLRQQLHCHVRWLLSIAFC